MTFQNPFDVAEENRAVSPVIGVILMVAITVILAAVIGAFVLEIGDQQDTAPSTSFDTQEQVKFVNTQTCDTGSCQPQVGKYNLSEVSITHAGGEVLDISQTEIKVDGNLSVWGPPSDKFEYFLWTAGNDRKNPKVIPQPNFCRTAGTNEEVTFSSGQTWRVLFHGGQTFEGWSGGGKIMQEGTARNVGCTYDAIVFHTQNQGDEPRVWGVNDDDTFINLGQDWVPLQEGKEVTVVWSAESGGKTQTLQRYTVQSGGDF